MDNLLTKETLDLFFLFVVPGVIAQRVYSLLIAGHEQKLSDRVVECLTFSMIHLVLFHSLYDVVTQLGGGFWSHTAQVGLAAAIPAIEAYVLVRVLKSRWFRHYLKAVHPTPKAWDHVFGLGVPFWAVLTLKSGRRLGGYYGPNSFASSFPNPEQIYLEQVWKVDDSGEFIEQIEKSAGAIIPFADCEFIEFFHTEDAQNVGGEQIAEPEGRLPADQERLPAIGTAAPVVAPEGG